MSRPLINRRDLRSLILSTAAEWQINRQRIPSSLIQTLEEDFRKQVSVRTASLLNSSKRRSA